MEMEKNLKLQFYVSKKKLKRRKNGADIAGSRFIRPNF